MIYPWQTSAWQQIQQLQARLPHALLLHGNEGIGKRDFAKAIARAQLCEQRAADGHACGVCVACNWFDQGSHPDFRWVRPDALADAIAESGEGVEEDDAKPGKAGKTPSSEIRVEQIRALAEFMNLSTHRHGLRVVLLYPAEALNGIAANALLKILEEPNPGSLFLLVSNRPDRLLPTILSRCRKFGLPLPPADQALAWLQQQGVADAEIWLAERGGAPLQAQRAAQQEHGRELAALLDELSHPAGATLLKTADALQKTPLLELVDCMQRWLYDLLSVKLSGIVRYYPRHAQQLAVLAAKIDLPALLGLLKSAAARRAIATHPLSAKLFIEQMLLEYGELVS